MIFRRFLALIALSLFSRIAIASADTLTVMAYNLLYYGVNTSFCNAQNNNPDLKDAHLRTIISHTLPDLFAVNELGRGQQTAGRILDQVMNTGGRNYYSMATYTNTTNSSIVNMLYYRRDRFVLHNEAVISNVTRDINLYTLYLRTPELEAGDTTFITCIVAHLKAGSSSADQLTRLQEVQASMAYIAQSQMRGNLLFMGDLNLKSSYESAYGLLTYHPVEAIRFFDPIDKPGVWSDNQAMALYHTQSTRAGSQSCFVAGGMDDRFDHILVSKKLLSGEAGLIYLTDSYKAPGQDGKRLNQSLIDPPNTSEPAHVIEALYYMSDHLPVMLKLVATKSDTDASFAGPPDQNSLQALVNPSYGHLKFNLKAVPGPVVTSLFTLTGEEVFCAGDYLNETTGSFSYDIEFLPPGVYVLYIRQGNHILAAERIVKL